MLATKRRRLHAAAPGARAATMAPPRHDARMDNPLLAEQALPRLRQIRPEHVEPAVRELLAENRARIEELAQLPRPDLRHAGRAARGAAPPHLAASGRRSSHLNAVLNSEALRESYNACLPLLSAYHTDLAQSEPLYRAYRAIAEQRGRPRSTPVQRKLLEHAVRDFRLAGVGLPRRAQGALQASDAGARAAAGEVRGERARCHQRLDAARHRRRRARADSTRCSSSRRARRAHASGARGLAVQARSADLRGGDDRRRVASRCGAPSTRPGSTRASDQGPSAGRWDNPRSWRRSWRCGTRWRGCSTFDNFAEYALATRMAQSVERGARFPATSCRERAPRRRRREFAELEEFAGRKLEAWDVAFFAERLQRERFSGLAGGAAPLLPAAAGARGAVRGRRAAVRRAHPRAPRRAVWHPDVRYFDIAERGRRVARAASISMPTRAPTSAAARGWTSASAASACLAERRCRSRTWCATSCRRARERRRC